MTVGQNAILILSAVVFLACVGGWFSWTAGRLDRLHLRCEGSRQALEVALSRRQGLAVELALGDYIHGVDPASAVLLLDAATRTTQVDGTGNPGEQWQHESDMSAVLRAVAPSTRSSVDGGLSEVSRELDATAQRVCMARRIHNDLVATTLGLRSRRRVRWFGLAGHASAPSMIAFDDEPPRPV